MATAQNPGEGLTFVSALVIVVAVALGLPLRGATGFGLLTTVATPVVLAVIVLASAGS